MGIYKDTGYREFIYGGTSNKGNIVTRRLRESIEYMRRCSLNTRQIGGTCKMKNWKVWGKFLSGAAARTGVLRNKESHK